MIYAFIPFAAGQVVPVELVEPSSACASPKENACSRRSRNFIQEKLPFLPHVDRVGT